MTRLSRSVLRAAGASTLAVLLAAHVGSPDVFYVGRAGAYDVRVTIRPPQVVPGIAQVVVRVPPTVQRVSIRPVYWRAGSRGAPSPEAMHPLEGAAGTFEGSLWLMARGAYSVDVVVQGASGAGNVLVPVASVATGRLALDPALGALLVVLGVVLCAGLINIVYKGAGESLVETGGAMDAPRTRRARRAAAIATPILALALLGGARWWGAVDRDYQRTIYKPSPLALKLDGGVLRLQATDTLWQPGRPSALVPDHGKLMHLFLVEAGGARAFAHLHPAPVDSSAVPAFVTTLPPLPPGTYRVFADVVHETGFERTLVGTVVLHDSVVAQPRQDPDDAFFVGDASRDGRFTLADGSTMQLELNPVGPARAGRDEMLRVTVRDRSGKPARLEPYLGMSAHAVVERIDGEVYVHLHPMGTVALAAQDAFVARDRGDTTIDGRLLPSMQRDARMPMSDVPGQAFDASASFPYAFPRGGSYRVFVQVKRNGRVLTGAYAIDVAEASRTR